MSYPKITEAEIDNWFTYHAPDEVQRIKYELIREEARHFAKFIMRTCPESQETWQAIFELRSVTMWANAAIACKPDPTQELEAYAKENSAAYRERMSDEGGTR